MSRRGIQDRRWSLALRIREKAEKSGQDDALHPLLFLVHALMASWASCSRIGWIQKMFMLYSLFDFLNECVFHEMKELKFRANYQVKMVLKLTHG